MSFIPSGSRVGSLLLALLAGCSGAADTIGERDAAALVEGDAAGPPADAARPALPSDSVRAELAGCALSGMPEPQSIRDTVALLNMLPAPTSIPCLLASLPRPLSVVASSSVASLQPADGKLSPRLIIVLERLLLTVVPTGDGAGRLEFGEWVTPTRTLKGELQFPLRQPVAESAPYEGLLMEGASISSCGFCHLDEQEHPSIAGARVSKALRPFAYYEESLASVRAIRAGCDLPGGEGPHCRMLQAVFDFGEVQEGVLAEDVMEGF